MQDILVVEDNDDDFEATIRALKQSENFANAVVRCRDGLETWAYLTDERRLSAQKGAPLPSLILLDLNMPGLDGRKLLARLKDVEGLCQVPVVVMTTSAEPADINACYRAGANTYIRKPVSGPEFTEAVARLYEYWFRIAMLPG